MGNGFEAPLVSVIVPIYNGEDFLERCIESILVQKYKNIQVILIDDGSEDKSKEIIEKYKCIDNRITPIYKSNTGVSDSRNVGIQQAAGEWITFIDADDYIEKDMIYQLVRVAERENPSIIISEYFSLEPNNEMKKKFFNYSGVHLVEESEVINIVKNCIDPHAYGVINVETNVGVPWGKLYKRDFLFKNNIFFDKRLSNMEDTLFNIEAFLKAERIVYISTPFYHYRIRNGSSVRQHDEKYTRNCAIFCEEVNNISEEYNIRDELEQAMKYKRFCLFYECIRKSILRKRCCLKEKVIGISVLSKDCTFNGTFQKDICKWYSKAQVLYSLLVSFKMYKTLYYIMLQLDNIKKRKKERYR